MAKVIITPAKSSVLAQIKEVIAQKDLLFMLAYKDIRVKYAQTFIGLLWSIITPAITVAILYLVFIRIAKFELGQTPSILFILSGVLIWNYFSSVVSQAGSSFLSAQQMVQKIYFPRLLLPSSKLISALPELIVLFLILFLLLFLFGISFEIRMLASFAFIFLTLLVSLTFGIWISALSIRFRDIQHVLPFLLQVGLFITPVAYPAKAIPAELSWIYFLNPLAVIIEGFRWSLFGSEMNFSILMFSVIFIFVLFVSGIFYFNSTVRFVADYI